MIGLNSACIREYTNPEGIKPNPTVTTKNGANKNVSEGYDWVNKAAKEYPAIITTIPPISKPKIPIPQLFGLNTDLHQILEVYGAVLSIISPVEALILS